MKKFIAVLAVLALTLVASVAMAEVTVSGSVDIRSLGLNNVVDQNSKLSSSTDKVFNTQERIRINVDAKHENVKGRITIENDWDVWGRFESPQGNATITSAATGTTLPITSTSDAGRLKIREGWIDFTIPGAGPAHVKVGHQFLQLGNGWFFRSGKYGSDAWVVGLPGKNTIAFVDVKFSEQTNNNSDDVDAYVLLDNFKIDDTKTVGVYFARVADKQGKFLASRFNSESPAGGAAGNFQAEIGDEANIDTIGLWFNGKLGPINLQAELNQQMNKWKSASGGDTKFKGNQIVVQANMPINPLSVNATIAMGSGIDLQGGGNDFKQIVTALDADPHYTFVYEYLTKTACITSTAWNATLGESVPVYGKNTGFCNTTALNLGAGFAVSKNISVNLDYWMLKATEKVSINGAALSDDVGNEIDLVLKFKLYDQLTWNWQIGRLMPGKAYDYAAAAADDVDAIQGILSYKF